MSTFARDFRRAVEERIARERLKRVEAARIGEGEGRRTVWPRSGQPLPPRKTPELRAAVLAALQRGYSLARTAELHGVTVQTVRSWARRAGIQKRPGRPPRYSAELKAEAVRLVGQGLTMREVGRRLNVNNGTVSDWLRAAREAES